jgi:hypothetical protein
VCGCPLSNVWSLVVVADLPVIVFMTKIDECEPGLVGDLGQTFHSERLYQLVQVSKAPEAPLLFVPTGQCIS